MESLTPDNLASFIERAQRFLGLGAVDAFNQSVWYGQGPVTVEAGRLGETLAVRFNQEGLFMDVAVFPEDSPHKTSYELTDIRLATHIRYTDGTTSDVAFVRRAL
jgi:hypothetical protein